LFFAEPPPTQYDLRFMVGSVPVRVHPMFWLVTVLLGASDRAPVDVLLWVIAVFVSILVHEFGHVFAFRFYGIHSHVVLQAMGGLAVPDMMLGSRRRQDWVSEIVIAFAGPAAGFLLAALVCALVVAAGGQIDDAHKYLEGELFKWMPFPYPAGIESNVLRRLAIYMLFINIFWGLINLLPIFPLDGGRISAAVLSVLNPVDGRTQAFVLSIVVAVGMAILVYTQLHDTFMAIFFAFMAYSNYQILQAMGGGRGGWR
jgi:stage IV sporulation protein FB